jgi:hypothetical protein
MSRLNAPNKNEPRFDLDVIRGRQGELQIATLFEWVARGNGFCEVKTKSYRDQHFYIETAKDPGRRGHYCPSGISITTAEAWAFCLEGTDAIAFVFATDFLRTMILDPGARDAEERDGSCPTRGKLIGLLLMLARLKAAHR